MLATVDVCRAAGVTSSRSGRVFRSGRSGLCLGLGSISAVGFHGLRAVSLTNGCARQVLIPSLLQSSPLLIR